MSAPLNPKEVALTPAGQLWVSSELRLPAGFAYRDIFDRGTWLDLERLMRGRGNKRPRKDDLLRIIGSNFDVLCRIDAVTDGYDLTYYAGQKPQALAQVLSDLEELPAVDAAELKARARSLQRRWQEMGASRDDLVMARKRFAQRNHPDSNATDGRKLAVANSVLDAAMESLHEAA